MSKYSKVEEAKYFKDYQNGLLSKSDLMKLYMPGALAQAKKYFHLVNWYDRSDLAQEAITAVADALDKYCLEKGVPFSTYCRYFVQEIILEYLARNDYRLAIPKYLRELKRDAYLKAMSVAEYENRRVDQGDLKAAVDSLKVSNEIKSALLESMNPMCADFDASPKTQKSNEHEEEVAAILSNILTWDEMMVVWHLFGFEDGRTYTIEELNTKMWAPGLDAEQLWVAAQSKLRGSSIFNSLRS